MTNTLKLGVIGSPIQHSLSPNIHRQFARQFNHNIDYQKYLVQPEELEEFVRDFFTSGGVGLNVTLPHKQAVASLADKLSLAASITGSVNTLYLDRNNKLSGETTDGKGILLDFERQSVGVENKNVLIVGAGGATNSIVGELLDRKANIQILNRTLSKVDDLKSRFQSLGEVSHFQDNANVDIMISSISEFNLEIFSQLEDKISANTFCYDLNYGERADAFLNFCRECGAKETSDGLGMLLGQAAYSYQLWTGEMADISKVKL
ncbi:MAG: shikimate dehydrogenase [Kangiellaceae bacterium]|nr:shikimate dehydrogenase [Kangiellaceae bacterium]MCW8997782.1 shikimate dehydrogenase [Kangiellaceae bacterium]